MATPPLRVEWHREAARALEKLPLRDRERVAAAIDGYAAHGNGDVRILQPVERPPRFRLRVGRWRVIFALSAGEPEDVMRVLRIGPRGDVYKG